MSGAGTSVAAANLSQVAGSTCLSSTDLAAILWWRFHEWGGKSVSSQWVVGSTSNPLAWFFHMSAQGRFSTCSLKDETRNRSEYNWLVVLKIDVSCDLAVVLHIIGLTFILLMAQPPTRQRSWRIGSWIQTWNRPKSSVQPPSSLPICDCFDPVAEKSLPRCKERLWVKVKADYIDPQRIPFRYFRDIVEQNMVSGITFFCDPYRSSM